MIYDRRLHFVLSQLDPIDLDANHFTPAEHPEEWFAALLRDMFRRQRHGSG